MEENKIVRLHEDICGLAEDIKLRINLLRDFNTKALEVKEEIIKDSLEDDNEVNSDNYFRYAVDVKLKQDDILKLSEELRIKHEVYNLLEAGLDFPVEVIEILDKTREANLGTYYKVSNDRKTLDENRVEDLQIIKDNCKSNFENGFNSEWLKLLQNNK